MGRGHLKHAGVEIHAADVPKVAIPPPKSIHP
jgi:hypothetical protein